MHEGIEILQKTELLGPTGWLILLGILAFALVIIMTIIFIGITIKNKAKKKMPLYIKALFGVSFILFIVCFGVLDPLCSKPTGKYEYKVTLDDTVSANYLYNNFEIVGREGKIWVIRDK